MAGITLATSLVSTSHHPRRHRKGLHFPPPFQFESCLLLKAFPRPFLRLITERQLALKDEIEILLRYPKRLYYIIARTYF